MWLATLSRMTCPLDVSQFSFLGNDKICSEIHANVSERQQKHFLSLRLRGHVARLSLACLIALGDMPNGARGMSPSLARP